jgi:hypothetical protein
MKKIKKNYTNFILTVIAVAMIGILFKGQVIKPAHADALINQNIYNLYKYVVKMQDNLIAQHQQILSSCR